MVHTRHQPRRTGTLTTSLSGALAVSTTGLLLITGGPATAQAETSTAYGVSATGVEDTAPQPSVSSSAAVTTDTGSVSGLGWSVTGIAVKAGAGIAEATAASITVGGRTIGSVKATCTDGHTTYTHTGSAPADPKLRVSFGNGAGATIQILGAGDTVVQTITVAVARCGHGNPPTTSPSATPPTTTPASPPATSPTNPQVPAGRTTAKATVKTDPPAPNPQPRDGHQPVTG